jgi:microcystin-dependent protein
MTTIVETFPGTVGMGITDPDPSFALDISGTLKVDSLTVNGVSNSFFPSGSIAMWESLVPPTGWVVCDGANGTPDLRDRFILGAGSTYNPGQTGGSTTTSLVSDNLPGHTHTFTTSQDGSHNHVVQTQPGGNHTHVITFQSGGLHSHAAPIGSAGLHTHPISMGDHTHNHGLARHGNGNNHTHSLANDRVALLQPANSGNTPRETNYDAHEPNILSQYQRWQPRGQHNHNFGTNASGDHLHTLTVSSAGSHTHTFNVQAASTHTHNLTTGQTGSHLHPISCASANLHEHTGTTQSTGDGTALNIIPSYYVLVYIMKI